MKFIKYIFFIAVVCLPIIASAQESSIFKAQVLKIVREENFQTEDGRSILKQDLELIGLAGDWLGQTFEVIGIDDIEVLSAKQYEVGDKVLVNHSIDFEENDRFVIVDSIRTGSLFWLTIIFILIMIIAGGWKGLKALFSLALTMIVILGFIVPQIFAGKNPVLIAVLGSIMLIVLVIYLTEGWNKKSHLAAISMMISLIFTGLLSWFFVKISVLSGTSSEEILYLVGNSKVVNLSGLLLAGIILGTIGVLDDLVISQIVTVEQIKESNEKLSVIEVFKKARKVGVSHLASMTNTLFLAYTGAALPLLLLFYLKEPPFMTISQVLNSELIATEIVRTLLGVIGLISAMPLATWLAAKYLTLGSDRR